MNERKRDKKRTKNKKKCKEKARLPSMAYNNNANKVNKNNSPPYEWKTKKSIIRLRSPIHRDYLCKQAKYMSIKAIDMENHLLMLFIRPVFVFFFFFFVFYMNFVFLFE